MRRLHYNWATEVNGYGVAFREWLKLPAWAPLPFYSDHGVCLRSWLDEHERDSKAAHHLTWCAPRHRALVGNDCSHRITLRIPCPWVMYRRARGIQLTSEAQGTLVFLPHSLRNESFQFDVEAYLRRVSERGFPEPYMAVLHPNDLENPEYVRSLSGVLDYTCFGSNESDAFISNFYDLCRGFTHAVSCRPGSELFYCHELGLQFSSIPERVEEQPSDEQAVERAARRDADALYVSLVERRDELFSSESRASASERDAFVSEILSLDLADEDFTSAMRRDVRAWYRSEAPGYLGEISTRVARKLTRSR